MIRRRRRDEEDEEAWTPNKLVARRIAHAREIRGWTQEEAAEQLAPFLGLKWSPATFSIVERSVDGKRIRQFSADEIVALSRVFDLPIGFWFTPFLGDEFSSVKTPDAPPQVVVDALRGSGFGFVIWANEVLLWGSTQIIRYEQATGKIVGTRRSATDNKPMVEELARLRAEVAASKHFGALDETKAGLARVLQFLEDITTIDSPDDETTNDDTPPKKAKKA